ncbi:MAG: prepilin-type N-terminal cleavage/methylation domain-containing protein [Clostridiales bacterium]|nr:prepilin-type N-terminal cleavage/methylation domain-containing protein [Clostridiales bacterium]
MKNAQKGFTLVEVVVSFAVLAIVSGALLQMFVVSASVNRRAYDTDKASALAVQIQELFKQNPDYIDPDVIATKLDELGDAAEDPLDPNAIVAELTGSWQAPVSGETGAFEVRITRESTASGTESSGYYPDGADPGWAFGSTINELSLLPSGTSVQPHLVGQPSAPAFSGDVLILHYGADTGAPKHLKVTNGTGALIHIYVVEVPDWSGAFVVDRESSDGEFSVSAVPSKTGSAVSSVLTVTITRLSDGTELASIDSMRYRPAALEG